MQSDYYSYKTHETCIFVCVCKQYNICFTILDQKVNYKTELIKGFRIFNTDKRVKIFYITF